MIIDDYKWFLEKLILLLTYFLQKVPIHPNVFQYFAIIGTENEGVIIRKEEKWA